MLKIKVYMVRRNAIDWSSSESYYPNVFSTREKARKFISEKAGYFTLDKKIEPFFSIIEVKVDE